MTVSRHRCNVCGKVFEFDLSSMSYHRAFQIGFDHAWTEHPWVIEAAIYRANLGVSPK